MPLRETAKKVFFAIKTEGGGVGPAFKEKRKKKVPKAMENKRRGVIKREPFFAATLINNTGLYMLLFESESVPEGLH